MDRTTRANSRIFYMMMSGSILFSILRGGSTGRWEVRRPNPPTMLLPPERIGKAGSQQSSLVEAGCARTLRLPSLPTGSAGALGPFADDVECRDPRFQYPFAFRTCSLCSSTDLMRTGQSGKALSSDSVIESRALPGFGGEPFLAQAPGGAAALKQRPLPPPPPSRCGLEPSRVHLASTSNSCPGLVHRAIRRLAEQLVEEIPPRLVLPGSQIAQPERPTNGSLTFSPPEFLQPIQGLARPAPEGCDDGWLFATACVDSLLGQRRVLFESAGNSFRPHYPARGPPPPLPLGELLVQPTASLRKRPSPGQDYEEELPV